MMRHTEDKQYYSSYQSVAVPCTSILTGLYSGVPVANGINPLAAYTYRIRRNTAAYYKIYTHIYISTYHKIYTHLYSYVNGIDK